MPEWIAKKKAVINPKIKYEQCFKWAVIAALRHEEIAKDPQRISKLQRYELQYRWNGLDVSLVIQKIGKFEKNNPGTTINVLFNNKKGMYKAQKSEFTESLASKQIY